MFRLTHAIEHLKSQICVSVVVADEEWVPENLCAKYVNTPALLVRKSEMERHFNEKDRLTAPVDFVVAGDAFDVRGLHVVIREHPAGGGILTLVLAAGVPDHVFTGRH
ncbi:hypothetical protein [Lelliottia aquatilis]|uniref:hypothetical protein n=1 Tax=Lelliottia aquatilis TaxID=2080838 RepID=UPI0020C6DBF7|nr:hypothetical protein [Lelliottia aquatilis]